MLRFAAIAEEIVIIEAGLEKISPGKHGDKICAACTEALSAPQLILSPKQRGLLEAILAKYKTPRKEKEQDDSKGEIPIVGEGEAIVVNPADSGGSRYLLVEIYLTRADEKDKGFKRAIDENSKKLQALTMDILAEYDVEELSSRLVRKQIENDLKNQYQRILGSNHPIKDMIAAKWILQ